MPEFDEAMVERLAKALFEVLPAPALLDNETWSWETHPLEVKALYWADARAVLTALSQDYAIVPLAALEQKDAVLREIIDYTLPYDSCQKCPHVCVPNQSCHEQYLLDEARKALGEGVTRHVR